MSDCTDNAIVRRRLIALTSVWKTRSEWKTVWSQHSSVRSPVTRSSYRRCELSLLLIHYSEFAVREDFTRPFIWKLADAQWLTLGHLLLNSLLSYLPIDRTSKCAFSCLPRSAGALWPWKKNYWDNINLLHKVYWNTVFIGHKDQDC